MTARADEQWQIDNASHLKGVRLQLRRYTCQSERWDHDHCAACWAKFAELGGSDIQHEGYTTCDEYRYGGGYKWICRARFSDLRDEMHWTVAGD